MVIRDATCPRCHGGKVTTYMMRNLSRVRAALMHWTFISPDKAEAKDRMHRLIGLGCRIAGMAHAVFMMLLLNVHAELVRPGCTIRRWGPAMCSLHDFALWLRLVSFARAKEVSMDVLIPSDSHNLHRNGSSSIFEPDFFARIKGLLQTSVKVDFCIMHGRTHRRRLRSPDRESPVLWQLRVFASL